jgi:hypothetical protein
MSDPSARRDAHLHVVRRFRVGLVSAGVLGSLGVAGVVSPSGADAAGDPARTPSGARPVVPNDESFSQWGDDRSGAQPQHDGSGTPPDLQQGFGSSHGSTGGS